MSVLAAQERLTIYLQKWGDPLEIQRSASMPQQGNSNNKDKISSQSDQLKQSERYQSVNFNSEISKKFVEHFPIYQQIDNKQDNQNDRFGQDVLNNNFNSDKNNINKQEIGQNFIKQPQNSIQQNEIPNQISRENQSSCLSNVPSGLVKQSNLEDQNNINDSNIIMKNVDGSLILDYSRYNRKKQDQQKSNIHQKGQENKPIEQLESILSEKVEDESNYSQFLNNIKEQSESDEENEESGKKSKSVVAVNPSVQLQNGQASLSEAEKELQNELLRLTQVSPQNAISEFNSLANSLLKVFNMVINLKQEIKQIQQGKS